MRIKSEYKGQTLIKNTSLGNITVIVDNIDVRKYQYYVSIGFGYIFEKEPIQYTGIEADEQTEAPAPKPKTATKRKRANGQN